MTDAPLTPLDRALIGLTQSGLPLTPAPYQTLAEQLGCSEDEVIARLQRLLERGIIRRIGVVPNHYRLGYTANAMTVWDVDDAAAQRLGEQVGALGFVSHCYLRPRHLPDWPYNLFAMVHGRTRAEVETQIAQIRCLLADHCRQAEQLYSTRILKKTGLRLRSPT